MDYSQYQTPMEHKHFLNRKFAITLATLLLLGIGAYAGIWYWQNQQVVQEVAPTFTPRPSGYSDNYEDSPFGGLAGVFQDPAYLHNFGGDYSYAQDMGVKWNRGSVYFYWEVIDPKAEGHYKFKEFFEPNKGVTLNYDQGISEIPAGIYVLANISTLIEGSARTGLVTYASFESNQVYNNFVKSVVERYDGDDDFGCIDSAPDCYYAGDGQYPSQQTIDALKRNPVKYWQVGNVVGSNNSFATFQRVTYQTIKQAAPSARVLI